MRDDGSAFLYPDALVDDAALIDLFPDLFKKKIFVLFAVFVMDVMSRGVP